MTIEINKEEIINNITQEILNDIKNSNISFTNDEIKQKINEKLNKIFDNINIKNKEGKKEEINEDEKFIEKEFTNIGEINNQNTNTRTDDLFSSMLNSKDTNIEEKNEDKQNNNIENNETTEPTEKKKFFQEISELYKDELQNSLQCFKNALDSFKIMKKTSIVEKIGILLILAVPSIFGGIILLIFLLAILLLWQIYILLKIILKFFEKIKKSIKNKITDIKNKIETMKNGSGWINRLIFANALYSLIMFNGILYMLINGIIMPLKSAAEIDKILANFIAKTVKGFAAILKAPSEMALNTLNANALKSEKTKTKDKTKDKQKLRLKDLLKNKQQLNKISQNLNNLKNNVKTLDIKKSLENKSELENKKSINDRLNNLGENANSLNIPLSSQLSNDEKIKDTKNQITNQVMQNLTEKLTNDINKNLIENEVKNLLNDMTDKNLNNLTNINSERIEVEKKIQEDKNISNKDLTNNENNLIGMGVNPNLADNIYEKNIQQGVANSEAVLSALSQSTQDWDNKTESQKLEIALEYGKMRDSNQDIEQATNMQNDWLQKNPNAGLEAFHNEKTNKAEEAFREEGKEFADRYGQNCQNLIAEEMINKGLDPKHNLNDAEFKEIAKSIVEKSCCENEAEKIAMIKDLGEFNAAFLDKEKCRQELNNYQTEKGTFKEKENHRNLSRNDYREMQ